MVALPTRVLVVAAHPDDIDFGSGGSVAKWVQAGIEVSYCIVTDGDAGGFDPLTPRTEIPAIRRREQIEAAATLGVSDLEFLGYPDGALEVSMELRRDISRVIRKVRPERVVCPSPERFYERIFASHPDHLAAGEATLRAVYPDARNPFAHPELQDTGFEAHSVREVLLSAHPNPNAFEDVSAFTKAKVAAILCHKSQLKTPETIGAMVEGWLGLEASRAGLVEGSYAECFLRLEIP